MLYFYLCTVCWTKIIPKEISCCLVGVQPPSICFCSIVFQKHVVSRSIIMLTCYYTFRFMYLEGHGVRNGGGEILVENQSTYMSMWFRPKNLLRCAVLNQI